MRLLRKGMLLWIILGCLSLSAYASSETLITERQIYDFLTDEMGLPSASACGILANIEHESAFNPNIHGDHGTSYGLCQWHNNRYTALKNYCRGIKMDYRTVAGQLEYLKYELETSYLSLLASLKTMENTANGAYKAGYLWCIQFERPADMENKAVNRGNLAKGKYWNRYNSIIMLETEEVTLTVEEVREIVINREVKMAQPPEEDAAPERYVDEKEKAPVLSMEPYVPKHRPKLENKGAPACGFAVGMLFGPMSDGKKERFALPEGLEEAVTV